jgi:hypothetical protein
VALARSSSSTITDIFLIIVEGGGVRVEVVIFRVEAEFRNQAAAGPVHNIPAATASPMRGGRASSTMGCLFWARAAKPSMHLRIHHPNPRRIRAEDTSDTC